MPPRKTDMSIQELRRALAAKERQLEKLAARREKLLASLADVDEEIASLGGAAAPPAAKPGRKKPGPKPKAKKAKKAKASKKAGRKKRGGGKALGDVLANILADAPDGIRVKNAMNEALKAGYKTNAKDFYGIVAAALRDDERFTKVKRGVYKLA